MCMVRDKRSVRRGETADASGGEPVGMHAAAAAQFASGVRVATSSATDVTSVLAEISAALAGETPGFLLAFASSRYDLAALAAGLGRAFPGVPHAGGSTAGEIGLAGLTETSVVVMAFPTAGFDIVSTPLPQTLDLTLEAGQEIVAGLRTALEARHGTLDPDRVFALTLLDGTAGAEERVLAVVQRALDEIPLVGGSCGDDLAFKKTFVMHDGVAETGCGLLLLVHTDHRFKVFKADHFDPTETKLVVTDCDAEARVVRELDADPAAAVYASVTGVEPGSLSPMSFASNPLLVKVGGEYYCRSIQKVNEDQSLSFYCAVDTGIVLTVARPRDMVDSLGATLAELDREVGGLDFVIGFDCVLRRLEAENRQVIRQVSDLMRHWHVVGFNTYGEQFRAMHLNQTFTGVAFGPRLSA